jgi:DNA-directed RNA polymerase subunit RPC12/RpoP
MPSNMDSAASFKCIHCEIEVVVHAQMGTTHRNHCPSCLWSKHVDEKIPGDRASICGAGMMPIGITLKHEGKDKYTGKEKYGDVMLIHACTGCDKININRIAADDDIEVIKQIFETSFQLDAKMKEEIFKEGIELFGEEKRSLIFERLLGKQI